MKFFFLEFMSLLTKSQSSRMDDQRGLLSENLQLPDFLKTASSNDMLLTPPSVPTGTQSLPPSPMIVDRSRNKKKQSYPFGSSPQPIHWKDLTSPDREIADYSFTVQHDPDEYYRRSKNNLLEFSRTNSQATDVGSDSLNVSPLVQRAYSKDDIGTNKQGITNEIFNFQNTSTPSSALSDTSKSPATRSKQRLGSMDLISYDLSPRERSISFNEGFEEKTPVFLHNAIPTPERLNLLKGKTVRGRQNEKISYV